MPFFERPEPPPEDEDIEDDDDVDVLDETNRYLGGVVPLELLLARSDSAAVAIRGVVAYPDGFELSVVTFTRRRPEGMRRRRRFGRRPMFMDPFELYDEDDGGEIPPEFLRFGIEFPDGARVSNLTSPWPISADATEPMHGLEPHSGGGSDTEYTQEFWAWPLPQEGTVAFVCEWPAHEISETQAQVDGELFVEAAARAIPVWSDSSGTNTHVTRAAMMRRASAVRGHLRLRPDDESEESSDA
jgi:hypothetical protein